MGLSTSRKKRIWPVLLVCLAVAALYQGLQFFVDTGESLMDYRKDLFSTVKYQVMFWL